MRIGYFLYDESYSGVIDSQALDVVRFYNTQTTHEAVLIAALPFRTRANVLAKFQSALSSPILSMVAMPQRFQSVFFRIEAFRIANQIKKASVDILICRNAMACHLALAARKALSQKEQLPFICYDGRGALKAESEEYDVYPTRYKKFLTHAEKRAVLNADFRIAVTPELEMWWRSEYGYSSKAHHIIPTTISTLAENFDPTTTRKEWRDNFGFKNSDVVLAFAGGRADWQGLDDWLPQMKVWLTKMPDLKLLLLSPEHGEILQLKSTFPGRVINTFVNHEDVLKALSSADFGILWRKNNTTNKVASPTKFSEYLQAGLRIFANEGTSIGNIVKDHNLGLLLDPKFQDDYPERIRSCSVSANDYRLKKREFYPELINRMETFRTNV